MDQALPLAGVRVLDCSQVLAGPFATMLLADLGAEVWKLEPPRGDETRRWGPPFWGDPADGMSAYFASVNRGKRSLVVDLGTERGRAVFDRLADGSRLLFHNLRPVSASRLGLDADRLRERHPRLIVATVSGFGGQEANRPAYDLLAQAASGLMSITGEPGGGPMKVGVAVVDLLAGLEAAVGALAALIAAERDGGRRVEVSLLDAGLTGLINVLGNHLAGADEPRRHGNAHPNIVPYEAFTASDGDLVVAVGNDAQFSRLIGVLGVEDVAGRFATNARRIERRAELRGLLADAIAVRQRDELLRALMAAEVPAGPVNSVSQAVAAVRAGSPSGWDRQIGGIRLAPSPIRLDGEMLPAASAPPRLGEHTGAVLGAAGYTPEEIDELRASGVVS